MSKFDRRRSAARDDSGSERLQIWVQDHARIVMPSILGAALLLTVGIGLAAHSTNQHAAAAAAQVTTTGEEGSTLEMNAYPEVNALFKSYYDALAQGDTDVIEKLSSTLSEEEKIRIAEIAKYIETYPQMDVYTKPGPVDGSYVAYVYTTMTFAGHNWEVPGMQTMYVCTREDGSLFINNTKTQDKAVSNYIQAVSVEDDVVDLSNKTTAQYNDLVNSDSALAAYLNELSSNIDLSVGQQLGQLQNGDAQ